jgi:hypothetical protein
LWQADYEDLRGTGIDGSHGPPPGMPEALPAGDVFCSATAIATVLFELALHDARMKTLGVADKLLEHITRLTNPPTRAEEARIVWDAARGAGVIAKDPNHPDQGGGNDTDIIHYLSGLIHKVDANAKLYAYGMRVPENPKLHNVSWEAEAPEPVLAKSLFEPGEVLLHFGHYNVEDKNRENGHVVTMCGYSTTVWSPEKAVLFVCNPGFQYRNRDHFATRLELTPVSKHIAEALAAHYGKRYQSLKNKRFWMTEDLSKHIDVLEEVIAVRPE